MTQIYAGNVRSISTYESPGVSEWADMYHLLANNVVMIDRSEKIILPFNVKLFERFKLPSLDNAFTMTYGQCCERRATELYELAKQFPTIDFALIEECVVLINDQEPSLP